MNIISEALNQIVQNKLYGISYDIEIAKGKNKLKTNWMEYKKQFIRNLYFHFTIKKNNLNG